ncbi:MAG: hypothetical protein H7224_08060 [Polaromonas sp.]|nr:hypothetical protein [Polaromonas sp.]
MTDALVADQSNSKTPILRGRLPCHQKGVVLIISLILLVVISLLAVTSLRNAGSSESVAGNARTTELATQSADIALRYCESSVLKLMGGPAAYATTFVAANILEGSEPPKWQDMSRQTGWDSISTAPFVLPLSSVNQAGMNFDIYKRPPECMVEKMPAVTTGTSTFYVITARGFGPEVAPADASRSRPIGSEVWLQSRIEI